MADSASEMESDTSSIDGGFSTRTGSHNQIEVLRKNIESLQRENCDLKIELESYKLRCKALQAENKELRRASVTIQARAEQEEEFISNTLLKKINDLKKEKETLAKNYEQEEEFLTNDLSRKLLQLRQEKVELEQTLEKEQEYQVGHLMEKIAKLEAETSSKQNSLEQLRREKVELENALEQEQEALVNRIWKKMEKLEAEKRMLQEKLDQPVSEPPSPNSINNGDTASSLTEHINHLREEVQRLRNQLSAAQAEHKEKMAQMAEEERQTREQTLRLQRQLQMEIDKREELCRHLSESESSLEMDDERAFNEMTKNHPHDFMLPTQPISIGGAGHSGRPRTVSSPIPVASPGSSRPLSPGHFHMGSPAFSPPSPMRSSFGSLPLSSSGAFLYGTSPPSIVKAAKIQKVKASSDKFAKPSIPPEKPDRQDSRPDRLEGRPDRLERPDRPSSGGGSKT